MGRDIGGGKTEGTETIRGLYDRRRKWFRVWVGAMGTKENCF